MSNDILGARRAGLEEAFFAQQDAILRRRLGEADETKARRDALSAASGIKDDAVLDRLLAQNVTAATLAAVSLVPLVMVAWADHRLDDRERRAVLLSVEQAGLGKEHPSYQLFEGWLATKPPPELLTTWKAYVSALSATLSDHARQALKSELLSRARTIAEAAGGFIGIGPKVSVAEAAILGELEQAFVT